MRRALLPPVWRGDHVVPRGTRDKALPRVRPSPHQACHHCARRGKRGVQRGHTGRQMPPYCPGGQQAIRHGDRGRRDGCRRPRHDAGSKDRSCSCKTNKSNLCYARLLHARAQGTQRSGCCASAVAGGGHDGRWRSHGGFMADTTDCQPGGHRAHLSVPGHPWGIPASHLAPP